MTIEQTELNVLENVAKLCLKNATQYIKDAEILCSFKSYGHALALTVLSDVELGKSAIFSVWSKDLIVGTTLPPPFQSCFWEKKYGLFASKTWWVGLIIASNIEDLVQELLDASEVAGDSASKREDISTLAMKQIIEIARKMSLENRKLEEIEEYREKGFFIDFSVHDAKYCYARYCSKNSG